MDIGGIEGLGISEVGGATSIGAVTMRRSPLHRAATSGTAQAAAAVGAWQTQTVATLRQHLHGSRDGRHAAGIWADAS